MLYRGAAKEEGYCANSDLRGLQDHMNFHGDGDCVMRHSTLSSRQNLISKHFRGSVIATGCRGKGGVPQQSTR